MQVIRFMRDRGVSMRAGLRGTGGAVFTVCILLLTAGCGIGGGKDAPQDKDAKARSASPSASHSPSPSATPSPLTAEQVKAALQYCHAIIDHTELEPEAA